MGGIIEAIERSCDPHGPNLSTHSRRILLKIDRPSTNGHPAMAVVVKNADQSQLNSVSTLVVVNMNGRQLSWAQCLFSLFLRLLLKSSKHARGA